MNFWADIGLKIAVLTLQWAYFDFNSCCISLTAICCQELISWLKWIFRVNFADQNDFFVSKVEIKYAWMDSMFRQYFYYSYDIHYSNKKTKEVKSNPSIGWCDRDHCCVSFHVNQLHCNITLNLIFWKGSFVLRLTECTWK